MYLLDHQSVLGLLKLLINALVNRRLFPINLLEPLSPINSTGIFTLRPLQSDWIDFNMCEFGVVKGRAGFSAEVMWRGESLGKLIQRFHEIFSHCWGFGKQSS